MTQMGTWSTEQAKAVVVALRYFLHMAYSKITHVTEFEIGRFKDDGGGVPFLFQSFVSR